MYKVIGIMSGTSLDGLDIAYCEFWIEQGKWKYKLGATETIPYNATWLTRLTELPKQPVFILSKTDMFYGKYIGQQVKSFVQKHNLSVDFISSHGHTIFHNPAEGYTTQIGNGNAIYAETGIPTIFDFRSLDVALGGQGAPLVPIGDALLFEQFDACLNLGGFANISYHNKTSRLAFDIGPCNILLNKVAQQAGYDFDDKGAMAASGVVHAELLNKLNALPFYNNTGAKSLGREWVEQEIWPLLIGMEITLEDLLATFTQHIATQIALVIQRLKLKEILVTGGGAFNSYLLQCIQKEVDVNLVIPEAAIINYKEAIVFAFLGVLRRRNEVNALKEVTGAKQSSSTGLMVGF